MYFISFYAYSDTYLFAYISF